MMNNANEVFRSLPQQEQYEIISRSSGISNHNALGYAVRQAQIDPHYASSVMQSMQNLSGGAGSQQQQLTNVTMNAHVEQPASLDNTSNVTTTPLQPSQQITSQPINNNINNNSAAADTPLPFVYNDSVPQNDVNVNPNLNIADDDSDMLTPLLTAGGVAAGGYALNHFTNPRSNVNATEDAILNDISTADGGNVNPRNVMNMANDQMIRNTTTSDNIPTQRPSAPDLIELAERPDIANPPQAPDEFSPNASDRVPANPQASQIVQENGQYFAKSPDGQITALTDNAVGYWLFGSDGTVYDIRSMQRVEDPNTERQLATMYSVGDHAGIDKLAGGTQTMHPTQTLPDDIRYRNAGNAMRMLF